MFLVSHSIFYNIFGTFFLMIYALLLQNFNVKIYALFSAIFFVTKKQTPQTFSLLECMAALLFCLIIIATWFEMWRVKNRVVSDNADHAMDDLARNFGRKRILVIIIIQ